MAGHTCPRRLTEFGPWDRSEGHDDFAAEHGLIGQPTGCTFCGSMSPEDFMDAVRTGLEIGPTDKSYKLYIKGIARDGDPDEPRVLSHSRHQSFNLRPWKDLTRAERKAAKAYRIADGDKHRDHFWAFTPWGSTVEGKFYTQHLSEEQGHEFWGLHLEGKVNWGYPGRPYVPLFVPGPSTSRSPSED